MLAVVATGAAGLLALVPAQPAAAENYPVPTGGSWTVTGKGNGHGHGLSQYGARGAAIGGLDYKQILSFYYPNTAMGLVPSSTTAITVRLDSAGESTTVLAQNGLRVQGAGLLPAGVDSWRLIPGGGGFVVQKHTSSGWSGYTTVVAPTVVFSAPSGAIAVQQPGGVTTYRGTVGSTRVPTSVSATSAITVNSLSVDDYLRGVVPSEMPASWPTAALMAQTIAARSYAWYYVLHPRSTYYDICANTNCQQYDGMSGEQRQSNAVITQTAKLVLAYQNAIVFAEFSASNGGITSGDGVHPYFVTKADPYEDASSGDPYLMPWTRTISSSSIAAYYGLSSVTAIQINSRVPAGYAGQWGGLPEAVTITGIQSGAAVSVQTSGTELASAMGLPYRYFTIAPTVALGHLDSVSQTALHTYQIRGWSFDPTTTGTANNVVIKLNTESQTVVASLPRPDVQAAYHTLSANHGFDVSLTLPGGTTRVCAYGVMASTATQALLGCVTVTIGVNPVGNFESAAATGSGTFRLTGWEFDPDRNGGPGFVQVYVDYRTNYVFSTAVARPDVQSHFGLANATVGFTGTITMQPGLHTVCAYGLNASGTPGVSVQLNCLRVTA